MVIYYTIIMIVIVIVIVISLDYDSLKNFDEVGGKLQREAYISVASTSHEFPCADFTRV